jgi:hypothetical protein
MKITSCIWAFFIAFQALAHGNHHHEHGQEAPQPEQPATQQIYQRIGEAYVQRVKPIFTQKCFDCHSDKTVYPAYYKIPGIKQYIDSDISEAREHLDFSKDYPFISHASPLEDLDAIRKELDEGEMPPFGYRLAHRDSAVSEDEKRLIYDWVDWAKVQLKSLPGAKN